MPTTQNGKIEVKGFIDLTSQNFGTCCAARILYNFNLYDCVDAVASLGEEEYVTFLCEQIKSKIGPMNYCYYALVTNQQSRFTHLALQKAGFMIAEFNDGAHNAYWNMCHGPSAIITYMRLSQDTPTYIDVINDKFMHQIDYLTRNKKTKLKKKVAKSGG